MNRQRKNIKRKIKPTFAMVVEGLTEYWYLQMLKRRLQSLPQNLRIDIKPEIPNKKSLDAQYNLVLDLLTREFTKVFWIIDFDVLIKESNERLLNTTENPIERFKRYRKKLLKTYGNQVVVIVNNPCLEYWFLLHFEKTSKYFNNCHQAETMLKQHLKHYEKTKTFFTKQNADIFTKLEPYLNTAIKYAASIGSFDEHDSKKTICEMNLFFQTTEMNKYFK